MDKYEKLSVAWVIVYSLIIIFVIFGVVCNCDASTETEEDFARGELYWLTLNIYHEARGENPFGMLLVGLVTLDRQADGRWGDTIKEVVTAPAQFSWYWDGKSDIPTDEKSWDLSKKVAMFAQMTYSSFGERIDITYYHRKDVNPYWADEFEKALAVGNHIFYREVKNVRVN